MPQDDKNFYRPKWLPKEAGTCATALADFPQPANDSLPAHISELSDEALVHSMAIGEDREKSFNELFARHSRTIYSFISRLVSSRTDPEDLLQETFIRILTHAQTFKKDAAFRPWLFTIARNLSYNALKKTKSRKDLEVQPDLTNWQSTESCPERVDPGFRAEQQETQQRLLKALEELPPRHREIIVLTMFDGFSYEDASAITGENESTLRSRVFHGIRKLRDRLQERAS